MEHDPYSDLPTLPLAVQLIFQDIEPEHFELTTEMLEENYAVNRAVRILVTRYTGHLGPEVVEHTLHAALIAIKRTIEQAMRPAGDVTHDG
ncbi:hypothetical protein I3U64_17855 [Mycobacteroides abscessus subsp. abscessus]|nr:hypothetical protein [Mycobacteroides abscessus subsp. abscessus]MBN7462014.1 hypothetical protein [Mycobacteroides abscessus subsp. abscessus]MBN7557471.1 hypothetical protein [Mycobacteroides abscessus subsp. abscessus]QSM55726.1 hypothetical protein IN840_06150 [Mycobacteroides abscessus subsp. abscessus]QSN23469.1 hypothetical protein I3U41_06010 [Mycobacteroides abscessus subsp. abscessus]